MYEGLPVLELEGWHAVRGPRQLERWHREHCERLRAGPAASLHERLRHSHWAERVLRSASLEEARAE